MTSLFIPGLFLLPVLASFVWCVVEIVLFRRAKKAFDPADPRSVSKKELHKVLLIVSSILAGIALTVILCIAAVFALAISFM